MLGCQLGQCLGRFVLFQELRPSRPCAASFRVPHIAKTLAQNADLQCEVYDSVITTIQVVLHGSTLFI